MFPLFSKKKRINQIKKPKQRKRKVKEASLSRQLQINEPIGAGDIWLTVSVLYTSTLARKADEVFEFYAVEGVTRYKLEEPNTEKSRRNNEEFLH